MELIENAGALSLGDAWPCVSHADVEVAVDRFGGDADLARISKLDGVAPRD